MRFWLVPSETDHNVWFIFREISLEKCLEIKVLIRNNIMLPSYNLEPLEADIIRRKVLQLGDKMFK